MRKLPTYCIALCLCLLSIFSSSNSECGNSGNCQQGFVTGGLHTCIHEFPWTAGLVDTSTIIIDGEIKIFCGASIITTNFLISAGHCFKYRKKEIDRKTDSVRVYVGLDNRIAPNPTSTYHFIESVDIFPDWLKNSDSFDKGNDLAMIKVVGTIKFSATVGPICLPSAEQKYLVQVGRSVKMAGFGTTSSSEISKPQNLKKGEFKILDCDAPNNICAAETENGRVIRATCNGDSGSGLVGDDNGSYFLVGLVSWGRTCGETNFTTRYVNVFNHLQWIQTKIKVCYSVQGSKCILPFRFNRKRHDQCISSLPAQPDETFAATCPTTLDSRGEGENFENCNRKCPGFKEQIHGRWDQWSSWTRCTDGCKSGARTRSRNCSKPQYGGHSCKGDDTEDEQCNTQPECEAIPEIERSCPGLDTCETKETCPYIQNKYGEALQAPSKKKEIVSFLKSLICNKQRQAFCCPAPVLNVPLPFSDSTPVKYETHEELMNRFDIYASKFPSLAVTNSIGRSVEGRELKYLKITKDANRERKLLKPMVKFIANIHGDEPVGRQMLQYLAQDLLHDYNNGDALSQFLVNNTEIYFLPDMNPDGFARSSPGPRPTYTLNYSCPHSTPGRVNSNGKDLNTDFPNTWTFRKSWDGSWDSISLGRQPETLAIIDWTIRNPFVLSANFHSGALVASYPFDTQKPNKRKGLASETPDEDLFKRLATIYSENNINMLNQKHEDPNQWSRLHKCSKGYGGPFKNGVTNGAAWSNLEGSMQDFNYAYTNCMEITLELSCCKYPPPELLEDYWRHNRNSLLYYTEAAHLGVKGMVTDSDGNPIERAKIRVGNNQKTVNTSKRGEYWRLLLPGNYTLTASADGYDSSTISIHIPHKTVDTWETPAQIQNFVLTKSQVNNIPEENQTPQPVENKARSNQNRRLRCCRNAECRKIMSVANRDQCPKRTGRRNVQG